MLTVANEIIALIVATIGATTTIFNIFFKGERRRKQAYYDRLLRPFFVAYKKNSSIDAKEFVENNVERDDDDVPKYIFYLVDTQTCEDDLKKVMIDDYFNLYPNEYNKKRSLFQTVHKLIDYVMFLLLFLFAFFGALVITSGFMTLITLVFAEETSVLGDWWNGIKELLIGAAISFAGLIPVKISEWLSEDMYSVKRKYVRKTIKRKIRRYDRCFNDYII